MLVMAVLPVGVMVVDKKWSEERSMLLHSLATCQIECVGA
jgi:hypothetical protein